MVVVVVVAVVVVVFVDNVLVDIDRLDLSLLLLVAKTEIKSAKYVAVTLRSCWRRKEGRKDKESLRR